MGFINLGEPLAQLVGTGVMAMGIMNWIGGSDSGDAGEGDVTAETDGGDVFADDGGGDDPFGGMDDEMDGDMDDWGDDAFGDMDGGGDAAATEELENRMDELESEVAQLSSSVNTVRSENEEIAESVGETEENVRKLLEIYEMVTRGVNPFVDEGQGGMGGSLGGGDFGLFGGDEGAEEVDDDLDDDVLDAEAESFFDDDAFEEDEEEAVEDDLDAFDDFEEGDDGNAEFDEFGFEEGDDGDEFGEFDDHDGDDGEDSAADESGGSTFADLKAEYESGDADWADEGEGDGFDEVEAKPEEPEETEFVADGTAEEAEYGADIDFELDNGGADDGFDVADDDGFGVTDDPEDEFEYAEAVDPEEDVRDPYLTTLPEGYLVDLVVLEWLDALVEDFGAENAVRALDYYTEIDWLSATAADDLMVYLAGLTDVEPDDDLTGPAEMDVDDHVRSLTFITKLAGDGVDRTMIERRAHLGEPEHGLQC